MNVSICNEHNHVLNDYKIMFANMMHLIKKVCWLYFFKKIGALCPQSTVEVMGLSVIIATLFRGKPPIYADYLYLVHIISPLTDKCSYRIIGRGRMAVEIFS